MRYSLIFVRNTALGLGLFSLSGCNFNVPPGTPVILNGPAVGGVGTEYPFTASATDPDGDSVSIRFDWDDDSISGWTDFFPGSSRKTSTHAYTHAGGFNIKAQAKDTKGAESEWSAGFAVTIGNPPSVAKPWGPPSGEVNISYSFVSSGHDPDGDSVAITFDWGDGTQSNWSAFAPNDSPIFLQHSYSDSGIYYLEAKAKSKKGIESAWSAAQPITIPGEGTVKWKFQTGGAIVSSPAIGDDGTVYVGSKDTCLYAINPDGSLKWKYPAVREISTSPVIGADGTIYLGTGYHCVAIHPDGTLGWNYEDGDAVNTPALGADGTIYISNPCGCLTALTPGGSLKWRFVPGGNGFSINSPTIGGDGTIYIADRYPFTGDVALNAIGPDGIMKWRYPFSGWGFGLIVIGADGTILASGLVDDYPTNHYYLYAFDANGTVRWKREFPDASRGITVSGQGTIYIGMYDGLWAVDTSGNQLWKYPLDESTTPALASNGVMYVGSLDAHFYAITSAGNVKWSYTLGGSSASSPAIGSDGTVYIGASDGCLYAIRGSAGPASGLWPMMLHDRKHTSRAGG